MRSCTFFGHREVTEDIGPVLGSLLIDLIENQEVSMFYVGNQGRFDAIVRGILRQLQGNYPHIRYAVVFAYMPTGKQTVGVEGDVDTIYPAGLENTPPKYAISKRNHWMIDRADYVVTYVRCDVGGAAQFKKLAEKKGKCIIEITENSRGGL